MGAATAIHSSTPYAAKGAPPLRFQLAETLLAFRMRQLQKSSRHGWEANKSRKSCMMQGRFAAGNMKNSINIMNTPEGYLFIIDKRYMIYGSDFIISTSRSS